MTTTYHATMMHGRRGGEGKYDFDAPDDRFLMTPVRIMRFFMDEVKKQNHLSYIDYEINAAFKNKEAQTVAVVGVVSFSDSDEQPFVCMISPKDND